MNWEVHRRTQLLQFRQDFHVRLELSVRPLQGHRYHFGLRSCRLRLLSHAFRHSGEHEGPQSRGDSSASPEEKMLDDGQNRIPSRLIQAQKRRANLFSLFPPRDSFSATKKERKIKKKHLRPNTQFIKQLQGDRSKRENFEAGRSARTLHRAGRQIGFAHQ